MTQFEITSRDNIKLRGVCFPKPDKVRAVMTLVHGFGEHSGRYANMAEALAPSGIATVALDLRGHGRSEGKRGVVHNYAELLDDLTGLLEKSRTEYPNIPHILYGHSMGGGLVINYMLRERPDDISAVIASAPLLRLAKPVSAPLKFILRGLTQLVPGFSMSQPVKGEAVSNLPTEQALYIHDPLNHGTLGGRLALGMIARGQESLSKASEFSHPLLLLHSREDSLTDFTASKTFSQNAQNCVFLPFAGVAHEMHNDTSRPQVYLAMTEFIEAHI